MIKNRKQWHSQLYSTIVTVIEKNRAEVYTKTLLEIIVKIKNKTAHPVFNYLTEGIQVSLGLALG